MIVTSEDVELEDYFMYIVKLLDCTDGEVDTDPIVYDCCYMYLYALYTDFELSYTVDKYIEFDEKEQGIERDEYVASCNIDGYDLQVEYNNGTVTITADEDFSFMYYGYR